MKNLYYLILLLFISAPLAATDYYVSKSGNDANEGSLDKPFLTITKAASLMFPGDVCYIMEGTYRETLTTVRNGTDSEPITFRNYQEDEVWIRATEGVTGWSVHAGNIWRSSVTLSQGTKDAVYYNDELLDLARWPNNEDNDKFTIDAEPVLGGAAGQVIGKSMPQVDLNGAYLWYLGAHSGTSWTRQITSRQGDAVNFQAVNINAWPFHPHNPTVVRNENRGRFFVFGALDLLDHEREWFYENGILYLQAPANADPNGATVEYAVRERTVHIKHDYITVEGINGFGGKVHLQGDYTTIRNCIIRHGLESLDELDNTDAQVGNGSIHIQSSNNLIDNNLIEYGSLNGIFMQGWNGVHGNEIRQNEIRYFNTVGIHASPIRAIGVGSKILYNTVYGAGRDGIFLPNLNCEMAYNDFSDVMRINNDGGLFYVVGNTDNKNTSVHHNWFHDSGGPEYADGRTAGIYLDNNSKGYDVYRNVVWNITWSAVQMNWSAWNNDIFNNSFWNVEKAMGVWLNGHTQMNNRIFNNYSRESNWEGQELSNNIVDSTDPFTDLGSKNFLPKAGSLLIDAGMEIVGITDGFSGAAPDVGAYELGGEQWIPGATRAGVPTGVFAPKVPELEVKTFPNPTNGLSHFQIELQSSSHVNWSLVSMDGRLLVSDAVTYLPAGEHRFELPTGNLPAGIYVLHGRTGEGFFTDRIVVE
ncbi:MAG: DUF1565 domain-containing protein [Saprospiraceae bacterium]|nr:DUF1565 domain-containing protein [Saprospiraceae bacterium]